MNFGLPSTYRSPERVTLILHAATNYASSGTGVGFGLVQRVVSPNCRRLNRVGMSGLYALQGRSEGLKHRMMVSHGINSDDCAHIYVVLQALRLAATSIDEFQERSDDRVVRVIIYSESEWIVRCVTRTIRHHDELCIDNDTGTITGIENPSELHYLGQIQRICNLLPKYVQVGFEYIPKGETDVHGDMDDARKGARRGGKPAMSPRE